MIIRLKNVTKPKLSALLQRRRTSLQKFILEHELVSYDELVSCCDTLGVLPPTFDEYESVAGRRLPTPHVTEVDDESILTAIEHPPSLPSLKRKVKRNAPAGVSGSIDTDVDKS